MFVVDSSSFHSQRKVSSARLIVDKLEYSVRLGMVGHDAESNVCVPKRRDAGIARFGAWERMGGVQLPDSSPSLITLTAIPIFVNWGFGAKRRGIERVRVGCVGY